jgi:ParB-like chromosome segregation protein Spo0J
MKKHLESFRVGWIEVPERQRGLDDRTVAQLMESIKRIGLRTPPCVRIVDDYTTSSGEVCDGQPVLITGRHRLEAVRRLGVEKVECWVLGDESESEAKLWEIAENLHRAELTELERDTHLAEWIRLTEQIEAERSAPPPIELTRERDPEPAKKRKEPKKKLAQSAPVSAKGGRGRTGGIRAASRELGIDRDDARRALKVASLTEEAKEAAKEVGLDDNRSALLKAAEQPMERQAATIREIAEAKEEARERRKTEQPKEPAPAPLQKLIETASDFTGDDPDHQLNLLIYAWEAADEEARRRFLRWVPSQYLSSLAA